jgi:NADH-quinone oxidoreductase subunit B
MTPDDPGAARDLGTGPDDATAMSSDQPGQHPGVLVADSPKDLMAPIVVPNTLWTSTSPAAYAGDTVPYNHLKDLGPEALEPTRWGALDVVPTKADYITDLIRMNSLWPLLSGLACCAIEMMSAATSKNDMDRWGMFPFRASPRQADVLIVAGTLTTKMAGPLVRLWEQMPDPKWCVAMGDCTCSGGRYKRSYSTIEGIDRVIPVDVYVPGCPPRPEQVIDAIMLLQQKIQDQPHKLGDRQALPLPPGDR